jgi:hypothetical protein
MGRPQKRITKQPLSSLQQEILRIAGEQKYVGYPDVLIRVYGFIPSRQGKLMFTRHRNVQRKIRSARVAICKSFNRLVLRGLVRRVHCENWIWNSITLIERGANFLQSKGANY